MNKTAIASLALLAAVPILALAWPPYGPGPGGLPPQYGYPGSYGPPHALPSAPWWPGYSGSRAAPAAPGEPAGPAAGRGAPLGGSAWPDYGRPLGMRPSMPRLDISRQMDDSDYLIDIRVQNIDPQQVEIRPERRGLVISYDKSVQSNQEQQLPGGEGYRRSYSLSRGATTRRIALPADAKLAEISREVGDGHIRLRIPRGAAAPGAHW